MHRVRRKLLERQATALGLPLQFICLPAFPPNSLYEDRVCAALRPFLPQGVRRAVFGDLFLEDIRAYRDRMLAEVGMTALYPVWGLNTRELAREFIRDGFRATLVCVDSAKLDGSFAGRTYDESLLADLPASADPCGENGEFHTFVHDGPIFRKPFAYRVGTVVQRGQFHFADLLPGRTGSHRTKQRKQTTTKSKA